MIEIEKASLEDILTFVAMEQGVDTKEFITPYSYENHVEKMSDPNLIYLRILNDRLLAGFLILALDADQQSVEFRRIVVAIKGDGIGQSAIRLMERFCRTILGRSRIWLDVFESNARGQHIYEKLGYQRFGKETIGNNSLLLYEKQL